MADRARADAGAAVQESASLAEEAAALFDVWRDRTRDDHRHSEHIGSEPAPECQWCPVCQTMALARSARPEVTGAVGAAAVEALGAFRDLLTAASQALARQPRSGKREDADVTGQG